MSDLASRAGWLGTGALIAIGAALLPPSTTDRDGEPKYWVADRDGCAVYGLDEDSIVVRRVDLPWPTAVAARADGGVWVLRSEEGTPDASTRLLRLDDRGAVRSETRLGTCVDLDGLSDGSAIVLERAERILRIDADGGVREVARGSEWTGCAALEDSIVVADARGIVWRVALDPPGAVLASADLRARILEVECDAGRGACWVITASEPKRIHRLDADLVVRWSAEAAIQAPVLAKDETHDRIWLVEGARSTVRRLDGRGVVELERTIPSILGACSAAGRSEGGIVLATPGGLVPLDPDGSVRPGQGGFAHLVDVGRVP